MGTNWKLGNKLRTQGKLDENMLGNPKKTVMIPPL